MNPDFLNMSPKELASKIEHTCLRADATRSDIERLCEEARQHGFHGVCVNGSRIVDARHWLEESPVQVVAVVGFPLGAMEMDAKRYETEVAVDNGAQEIDLVMNIGWLKDGNPSAVLRELRDVVEASDERPVKVILEAPLLTTEEKILACKLAIDSGARFVKTCTGFGAGKATVEDVRLLRETVGGQLGVKAAGGIRDWETAIRMIEAGATRIGASASVSLVAGPK